ncbi:MAG: DUF6062 family protein [Eubacteriales bacterium]|nr:DUF6062 family protein [Eubacteriales bacterium]
MRYSIDTIPVLDAFRQAKGCPFCYMKEKLEEECLEHYMGDSKMEPDIRIATNQKGFCAHHLKRMHTDMEGKLGLALIADTHMKQRTENVDANLDELLAMCAQDESFFGRVKSAKAYSEKTQQIVSRLEADAASCVVCERVNINLERYFETTVYLWENQADFAELFRGSDGFCLEHFGTLLNLCAQGAVSAKKRALAQAAIMLQKERTSKDMDDLDWFIKKYDYRNWEKPWGEAKTALSRVLNRLQGHILDYEEDSGK